MCVLALLGLLAAKAEAMHERDCLRSPIMVVTRNSVANWLSHDELTVRFLGIEPGNHWRVLG